MEPPSTPAPTPFATKKLKVLQSLKPWTLETIGQHVIRGQYAAGNHQGQPCPDTRRKRGSPDSTTETFVALRTEILNWRWAGVPFYIRTGKRLAGRDAHIVINFRPVPHPIFRRPLAQPTAW